MDVAAINDVLKPRLFLDGAVASCIAEAATLPLEVAKMRLQLQREHDVLSSKPRYTGLFNTFATIVRQERWYSLWKGLEAGLHKQILYTGLRLGLYEHMLNANEQSPAHAKIGCSLAATGIGIVFANPSDVIQTKYIAYRERTPSAERPLPSAARFDATRDTTPQQCRHNGTSSAPSKRLFSTQMVHAAARSPPIAFASQGRHTFHHHWRLTMHPVLQARAGLLSHAHNAARSRAFCKAAPDAVWGPKAITGVPLRNARMAYFVLLREEGFLKGLYRGFGANFACNCVQGATEIATYDTAKNAGLKLGIPDSMPLHLVAGLGAGLVATIVSNPFDVVSTRLMAAKKFKTAASANSLSMMRSMWQNEGIGSFYKGFGPNVLRIGAFNIVMWLSYEQVRKL